VSHSSVGARQGVSIRRLGDKEQDRVAFSTVNNRLGYSNDSVVLTALLRLSMRATVGIINAGGIRGSSTYPMEQEWSTWSDLKAEIPFETNMVAVEIPGKVIEDMITESRTGIRTDPPMARGGYLHHCDQIKYNNEIRKIETIRGEPIDPKKL
jgi:2',3'-cyclic-nucleotide 2'-phosphodiesterase (5'-nucleotidase family)